MKPKRLAGKSLRETYPIQGVCKPTTIASLLTLRRMMTAAVCFIPFTLFAQPANPVDQYVQDGNTFSLTLFKQAAPTEDNTVFSPYSIFSCLSMLYSGAKGETATQIRKTLFLHAGTIETAHAAFSLRNSLLTSRREGCDLRFSTANGLFADQDTFILSSFRELVQKNYNAELASLDFSQSDKALMTINGWVSNETKGKIPNLLHKGDINTSTRLVLVNAAYFQAKWLHPFDPKATQESSFHVTAKHDVQVPMMEQTSIFSYNETDTAQVVSLPFQTCDAQDPRINCIIILPKSSTDQINLEESFSPTLFKEWIDRLELTRVTVRIPTFCMKIRLDLNSILSAMGMPEAFTNKADFSAINGMHDLFLSKVIHETYFSFNEYGVEAATGTSAIINMKAIPDTKPPLLFTADHPFYFFLVDSKTQMILFAGQCFQPHVTACQ